MGAEMQLDKIHERNSALETALASESRRSSLILGLRAQAPDIFYNLPSKFDPKFKVSCSLHWLIHLCICTRTCEVGYCQCHVGSSILSNRAPFRLSGLQTIAKGDYGIEWTPPFCFQRHGVCLLYLIFKRHLVSIVEHGLCNVCS